MIPLSFIRRHGWMRRGTAVGLARKWFFASFLGLATGLAQPALVAGKDSYVEAIEAEGNWLEFLGQAKKEQELLVRRTKTPARVSPKPRSVSPAQTAKALSTPASAASASSVTQEQFEHLLRESFPGSYALYSMFEPRDKEAVYREYEDAKTQGTIRFLPAVNKIIALSSLSNKAR